MTLAARRRNTKHLYGQHHDSLESCNERGAKVVRRLESSKPRENDLEDANSKYRRMVEVLVGTKHSSHSSIGCPQLNSSQPPPCRLAHSERHVVNSMIYKTSSALWKPHMHKKGIAYYVDESVGKGLTRFCCVGVTDAPVQEIMKMFLVTNTEMLLKNVRIIYRHVKEAKILSVLAPASMDNPMRSVYIRYASFDTPTPMKGRDICVCVCTNMFQQPDGSTVGYCLWDSVDIPECPDRFATDKIIRSKMWHSGFLLWNSGKPNAVTKVCYLIGAEIKGIAPQLTGRIHMNIFGGNCRRVCRHFRTRALDPETFAPPADWTPEVANG